MPRTQGKKGGRNFRGPGLVGHPQDAEMAAELRSLQVGEEEAALLRKQVMAAWRPCGSNLLIWERMELRPLYKGSKGKCERHKGRRQEKKKEEAVNTNKSKTRPVSNWRCRGPAGVMKALQRVVWSLIFLGFGVHVVKAEEQGSQVKQSMSEKDFHQIRQVDVPWMRKKMLQWDTCEGSVNSIPPNTAKWLRKFYNKNYNNDTSNETKHETNYSINNKCNE